MGLRELKRERTRRLIADKAFELFTDHGFGRTTVEQIAAAAAVGPSTLYRYFPTKETLVLEFVEDCLTDAVDWFREQPGLALTDGLQAVIERVLARLESNPDRIRAVFDLAEKTVAVSAHLNELIWRFRNDLADELVRRLPARDPRDAEFVAALAAGIAMNIIETVVRIWVENPKGVAAGHLARRAMTLLHNGGIPLPRGADWVRDNSRMAPDLDPSTVVVHAGRPERVPNAPVGDSPVFSSTYVAGGDRGYGRFGNDSWSALEETLGELEGGRGLTFASGMAAVAAIVDLVPVGGRIVAPQHAYSGVLALLDQQAESGRLTVERVNVADTGAVVQAVDGADMLWIESPTNPAMEVADIPALVAAGHATNAIVVVDNTFATPLLQQPLRMGADIVMHSATKFIAGHSDVILGAVVTADDELWNAIELRRRSSGAIPGPMEAWLTLRGLRTLALRLERAQSSAAFLAQRLLDHPRVSRVRYPGLAGDPCHKRAEAQMSGFGAILSIELGGDAEGAQRVCESTKLWVHATSLGGVESMLERRRRWPIEVPTIPDDLIRLAVGIEHPADLWADLEQALTNGI